MSVGSTTVYPCAEALPLDNGRTQIRRDTSPARVIAGIPQSGYQQVPSSNPMPKKIPVQIKRNEGLVPTSVLAEANVSQSHYGCSRIGVVRTTEGAPKGPVSDKIDHPPKGRQWGIHSFKQALEDRPTPSHDYLSQAFVCGYKMCAALGCSIEKLNDASLLFDGRQGDRQPVDIPLEQVGHTHTAFQGGYRLLSDISGEGVPQEARKDTKWTYNRNRPVDRGGARQLADDVRYSKRITVFRQQDVSYGKL
nr:hypothetical protein [Micromonospora sp. MA102]